MELYFYILAPFFLRDKKKTALFALTRRIRFDRLVGELSYGVYIIHVPLLMIVNKLFPEFRNLPLFLTMCLLTITLSLILHHAIERPLARYRERFVPPEKKTEDPMPCAKNPVSYFLAGLGFARK
jgi:peptidoglycan/LPS O-acetylase OafA/YrhL